MIDMMSRIIRKNDEYTSNSYRRRKGGCWVKKMFVISTDERTNDRRRQLFARFL